MHGCLIATVPEDGRIYITSVLQVENDVYCTYANRVNYEAKGSPVPPDTDITTLSGVLHVLLLLQHDLLVGGAVITMTCSVKQSLLASCRQQQ